MGKIEWKLLSSLEKLFADDEPEAQDVTGGSMLKNEQYSLQIAVRTKEKPFPARLELHSALSGSAQLFTVEGIPIGLMSSKEGDDEYYIRKEGKPYPDLLREYHGGETEITGKWTTFWCLIELKDDAESGTYPLQFVLKDADGAVLCAPTFELCVLNASLPEQTLRHTEWLYTDCIAQQHRVEMFSEEYWCLLEKYLRTAVRFGVNMIYTPVVTSLQSSREGLVRPETQLTDVFTENGSYRFGFSRLERFIEIARRCGIRYFEMAHLFSPWGAAYPAQVSVYENGEKKRMFGYEMKADDPLYAEFLKAFLPALTSFLTEKGLESSCYFHVSDEPVPAQLKEYSAAARLVRENIPASFKMMDALSDIDFYSSGAVQVPVTASNHMTKFLEADIPERWVYYSCAQGKDVSNRFFAMPSYRNRVFGLQLYINGIDGFLQWGFNYWQDVENALPIDPFTNTDVGGYCPSGDAYLVYPGENGPMLSLRIVVFMEALQDMRALQLLEQRIGRKETLAFLKEHVGEITFTSYPHSAGALLRLREAINEKIMG